MNTLRILLPFVFAWTICCVLCVKVDKLGKEPRDANGRRNVESMIAQVRKGKLKSKDKNGNGLRLRKIQHDNNGNKVSRLQQEYDDLEVFGYEVILRENRGTSVAEMDKTTGRPTGRKLKVKKEKKQHGKFALDIEKELGKIDKSKLNPVVALQKLKNKRGQGKKVFDEHAESVIFVNDDTGVPELAYKVSFSTTGDDQPKMPAAIYGADGRIIREWDNLQHAAVVQTGTGPGGNEKIGQHLYGDSKPSLSIKDLKNGSCVFETEKVKVIHGQNSWDMLSSPYQFSCYEQASDAVNGGFSPLNDANHYGNVVYDMFQKWYKTPPLSQLPITFHVHVGNEYENAFWHPGVKQLFFGDGSSNFHPMVSLDVVAHEIGHGFTNEHSDLIYDGQSGALNEAFSDMMGKAAERFAKGYDEASFDWNVGSDIYKAADGKMRCMDNPRCDGESIDNIGDYHYGMDVHLSSGIFNKVFYLLASKLPFDLWDTFDLFYVANSKFWQANTDLMEAAELTLQAMEEMKEGKHLSYAYDWVDLQDVIDAFDEVGIQCEKDTFWGDWDCNRKLW